MKPYTLFAPPKAVKQKPKPKPEKAWLSRHAHFHWGNPSPKPPRNWGGPQPPTGGKNPKTFTEHSPSLMAL